MRIIFLGTPEFALPSLRGLISSPHQVLAVVTKADRPAGRGRHLLSSPVKNVAIEAEIPVLQPVKLREAGLIDHFRELSPDAVVVVAYGQLIPRELLEFPRYGCINLHPSLLPKYRGAAPIAWPILEGDEQTGVTVMILDEGMDTGPILAQKTVSISPVDTTGTLEERLSQEGAQLLLRTLEQLELGAVSPQPQQAAEATYVRRLRKEDGIIDWQKSSLQIERHIRGMQPWPGAYTYLDGNLLKILRAETDESPAASPCLPGEILMIKSSGGSKSPGLVVATGQGRLRALELQLEGRKAQAAADFLRGIRKPICGKILGEGNK